MDDRECFQEIRVALYWGNVRDNSNDRIRGPQLPSSSKAWRRRRMKFRVVMTVIDNRYSILWKPFAAVYIHAYRITVCDDPVNKNVGKFQRSEGARVVPKTHVSPRSYYASAGQFAKKRGDYGAINEKRVHQPCAGCPQMPRQLE
jgi:hypothetical protein